MVKDIIARCKELTIYEKRTLTDEYCEIVFYTKDSMAWERVLIDSLGAAVKPSKVKPTKEHTRLTEQYGGIHNDQTLFRKEAGGITVIAMLWPWQNGTCITLKLALLKK